MAKFTFPLPGRSRKQPTVVSPSEPMTKAQRILGATELTVDPTKNWEQASNAGISVAVSETTSPTINSPIGYLRRQRSRREWGDDSDVLPEDTGSDYSSALREQASSSTIKSWYDKTKQPLAVTQQTSASAMAKGPPSKAQRVLDMDNAHGGSASKGRKKPAMLNLTIPQSSDQPGNHDWDGPFLGNNYVTRSPSILSPLTPGSGKRPRRRIQKRSTHESLRPEEANSRPATGDGSKKSPAHHLDELPSLYKHYEQMSFAQLMDDEEDPVLVHDSLKSQRSPVRASGWDTAANEEPIPETLSVPGRSQHQPPSRQDHNDWAPLSGNPILKNHPSHSSRSSRSTQPSQSRPISHTSANIPIAPPVQFIVAPPPSNKVEQPSPIDCGASISSRHTRTSKASRRTDKSSQTADLQGKSVLNLSSDSEEEDDVDDSEPMVTPAPIHPASPTPPRPDTSGPTPSVSNLETCSGQADETSSLQSSQPSRSSKRQSSTPSGFLTTHTHFSSRSPPQASTPTVGTAPDGLQPNQGLQLAASLSDLSLSATSNSSLSTTMTWHEHEGYGIQEARAITMLPAQGPEAVSELDMTDSDVDFAEPESVLEPESLPPLTGLLDVDQAPLLSPRSVEECLNSPESLDGAHEHFMGLTRQEQALIKALRQKREVMRTTGTPMSNLAEVTASRQHSFRKGHQPNNPSEVTITESNFNFGFPAPPSNRNTLNNDLRKKHLRTSSSMFDMPIPGEDEEDGRDSRAASCATESTMFMLSPPPSNHHISPSNSNRNSTRASKLHSSPSWESGLSRTAVSESASRESFGFYGFGSSSVERRHSERRPSSRNKLRDSMNGPRPRGSIRRQQDPVERYDEDSLRSHKPASRRNIHGDWAIMEEEPLEQLPTHDQQQQGSQSDNGPGIPRPDSPISPLTSSFPAVPPKRRTLHSQRVRLSAFGPQQSLGGSPGWWGDED
jgi:hypothetical protein